jgi:serine/threonine protein kinase
MEKYKQVKHLKEHVFVAENVETRRLVVIKEVHAHPSVSNEIRLLASLQHPNVVRLLDWFFIGEQRVALVMEHCEMGDLKSVASTARLLIPEICIQLLLALKYLHARGIIHRDLKVENVFVAGWQNGILRVKVGDFGVAKQLSFGTAQTETMLGTPLYFSPEQAARKPYDWAVDIWSLGCLIFELAAGRPPFGSCESFGELLTQIRGKEIDFEAVEDEQVRKLLKFILQKEAQSRPSIDDLLAHSTLQTWIEAFVDKINGKQPKAKSLAKPAEIKTSQNETFCMLTTIPEAPAIRSPLLLAHQKQVALARELPLKPGPLVLAAVSKSVHERLASILVLPSRIAAVLEGAEDWEALKRDLQDDDELEKIVNAGLIADVLYLKRLTGKKL